jgi:DNA-binding transcriptional ArsR family regulator
MLGKPKPIKGEIGMSLNPIVALSEQFQKLINEHGSAAILRDHLAMFKDQVLMLEKENLRLINESGAYKVSEEKLKSDIEHLQKENEKLRSKIQESEQSAVHGNLLDKVKTNILVALTKQDWNYAEHISRSLGISIQVVQFHLDELQNKNMVCASYSVVDAAEWSLDHEGRRYLIENGLIS